MLLQSLSVAADKVFRVGTTKLQLLAVAVKPGLSPGVRPAGQRPNRAISIEKPRCRPPLKPGVLTVQAGATKGHSVHLQQAAEISDLLKIQEEPPVAQIDPSALHLPPVAALLAQTAMGAVVRSDAAAAAVAPEATLLGAFRVVIHLRALPVAIHPEASPAVIPPEAFQVAVSQVVTVAEAAMAGVAEVVENLR